MSYKPNSNYREQGGDSWVINGTIDLAGTTKISGTDITTKLNNVLQSNDATLYTEDGAIATSGIALITGGTGISGLTLGAPSVGARCEIRIDTLSSGSVVVTTESGITFDGTNNTATFDAVAEALTLVYKSATEWEVVENEGSVALSDV